MVNYRLISLALTHLLKTDNGSEFAEKSAGCQNMQPE